MQRPQRIVIVGTSSSGKSTLANKLSQQLGYIHKELDAFNWEANWQMADVQVFRQRVKEFCSQEQWITDGNYTQVSDLVWSQATHMLWLDFPLSLVLRQFFTRSIKRSLGQEELWNGNRETLWNSMLSPDSLLLWILKTYRKVRKRYLNLMQSDDYPNLTILRFQNHAQTQDYLNSLKPRS